MRSLWLASAALVLSTGIACAQTAAAPAATNSANGPVETNPGLSPGQTTPPASTGQTTLAPAAPDSSASAAPAPDSGPGTPTETAPGASPGKTGPNTGAEQAVAPSSDQSASTSMPEAPKTHHWRHMEGGPLPADGSAAMYLHLARDAIRHNDKSRAEDALSHAETRILTRAVPQSSAIPVDDSPAIASIQHARQALSAGNMSQASSDTDMAMHQIHHGTMGGMGMQGPAPTE